MHKKETQMKNVFFHKSHPKCMRQDILLIVSCDPETSNLLVVHPDWHFIGPNEWHEESAISFLSNVSSLQYVL